MDSWDLFAFRGKQKYTRSRIKVTNGKYNPTAPGSIVITRSGEPKYFGTSVQNLVLEVSAIKTAATYFGDVGIDIGSPYSYRVSVYAYFIER